MQISTQNGSILGAIQHPYVPAQRSPDPQLHETLMADAIYELAQTWPDANIIVLTGDRHAIHAADSGKMATFLQMPYRSYRFTDLGGSAWVCTPQCGITRQAADQENGIPATRLNDAWPDNEQQYDGLLQLGNITAAEPAADILLKKMQ